MEEELLVLHCYRTDFDATTGQCTAPFYAPRPEFPPPLDVGESLLIAAAIGSAWGVGAMIKAARRASET